LDAKRGAKNMRIERDDLVTSSQKGTTYKPRIRETTPASTLTSSLQNCGDNTLLLNQSCYGISFRQKTIGPITSQVKLLS
jgi:hypothetical protein